MASQPEPSVRPRALVRRSPAPPALPAALQLIPGRPCPRCHGMVIVRDVVTPEGALTEHFCLGCSRSSHPILELPETVPRLRLTPAIEATLDRVVASLAREDAAASASPGVTRIPRGAVDDSMGIALSRSALDAEEIRSMFAHECQPDEPPWRD